MQIFIERRDYSLEVLLYFIEERMEQRYIWYPPTEKDGPWTTEALGMAPLPTSRPPTLRLPIGVFDALCTALRGSAPRMDEQLFHRLDVEEQRVTALIEHMINRERNHICRPELARDDALRRTTTPTNSQRNG